MCWITTSLFSIELPCSRAKVYDFFSFADAIVVVGELWHRDTRYKGRLIRWGKVFRSEDRTSFHQHAWLSAVFQGRVAAASIGIVAKHPEASTKGIIFCGIVEFYAILSLVATIMISTNILK